MSRERRDPGLSPQAGNGALHALEVAVSTAGDAIRAVELQAHRIRNPTKIDGAYGDIGFQLHTEARFLIVALRWLYRSCALVAELTNDASLRTELESTWRRRGVADTKDMRDVWEHFDDYVVGKGNLQKRGHPGSPAGEHATLGVYVWTGARPDLGSLHWAGLSVNLDVAVTAANEMYKRAMTSARSIAHSSDHVGPSVS